MKTKQLICLVTGVLFTTFSIAQSVDEIVSHYVDALGGKNKWDNLKTLIFTGSVEVGPNMKAPVTMYFKDKNKMRFEMELQGMKMIQALDGDSGWSIVPFSGKTDPERMSPEEVKSTKQQADFTGDLYNYKEKGNTVELLGKEDMEGTETYKLKVTKKDGDVTYMYLDVASYLSLKETSRHKLKDKEVETVLLPSDYRDVDGYKFAFALEMRGGEDEQAMGQLMTIDKIEVNPEIDNNIFAMPPVTSAVQPPAEPQGK